MAIRHSRKRAVALSAVLLVLTSTAASAPVAQGGEFKLKRATIDAGGHTSAGPGYQLRGTIGQPDAATMSGPGVVLRGGFWTPSGPSDGIFKDDFE